MDEWLAKRRMQAAQQAPVPQAKVASDEEPVSKTDFAKRRPKDSELAGSASDKDEVGNLAEMVKKQIGNQPNAQVMDDSNDVATAQNPASAQSPAKDPNEINIDEHGNLSYQPLGDDEPKSS